MEKMLIQVSEGERIFEVVKTTLEEKGTKMLIDEKEVAIGKNGIPFDDDI